MLSNQSHLVNVIVRGKPVTKYTHENDTYIEGRPNSPYTIKIKNPTRLRMKAIVSVDGLSVMDGQPASERSTGYVLNPYQEIEIDGWRLSNSTAAKFVFGSKKSGYSNQSGYGTTNVGVIGVILIQEYESPPRPIYFAGGLNSMPYHSYHNSTLRGTQWSNTTVDNLSKGVYDATTVAMCAQAVGSVNNLGTQFGEDITSNVTETTFINGPEYATIMLFYDDRRGLEARGIVVNQRFVRPDPFPGSTKYCQRPDQTTVIR